MTKFINADRMLVEESEAYMNAQLGLPDETTMLINELVHKKIQMLLAAAPEEDAVPVVRCNHCKHYAEDHWAVVDGLPIIVCHEVCYRFCKEGNKVKADGWCFLAEKREDNAG